MLIVPNQHIRGPVNALWNQTTPMIAYWFYYRLTSFCQARVCVSASRCLMDLIWSSTLKVLKKRLKWLKGICENALINLKSNTKSGDQLGIAILINRKLWCRSAQCMLQKSCKKGSGMGKIVRQLPIVIFNTCVTLNLSSEIAVLKVAGVNK